MSAVIDSGWVSQALRWLPAPLRSALDAWSARRARARAAARRARLLARRSAS